MKHKFRFLFVLVPIAFVALASLVTMGLWNWLMPALFGLGTLTFLQAAGIFILAKLLFGHKGSHGWHGHHMRFAHAGGACGPNDAGRGHWMAHRWHNLTPEERQAWSGRCGHMFSKESNTEAKAPEEK